MRLDTIRVGSLLSMVAAIGIVAYAVLSWSDPNRSAILAFGALASITAIAVELGPSEKLVRSRHREVYFVGWAILNITICFALALADGGADSPLALLFFLPILFGTLSFPLRWTLAVGAIDVGALLAVAVIEHNPPLHSAAAAFVLLCAATLTAWESRNQGARVAQITEATAALRSSAVVASARAVQQEEVAKLGDRALGGLDLESLAKLAADAVLQSMGVEMALVLRLHAAEGRFDAIAFSGYQPDNPEDFSIPADAGSQAGYTIATGTAVIVSDWGSEERFRIPKALRPAGFQSGVSIVIWANGAPYGVLSVQSTNHRNFGPQDLTFLQAVVNVLGHATELRVKEQQIRHDALHDPLTGLANRNLFLDRLDHALVRALRSSRKVAVLFLDLDQFKRINDSFGHSAGDELIAAVALRLVTALRPGDTIARFGGDAFTVLLEPIDSPRDAETAVERIQRSFERPIEVFEIDHFISASIGIAIGDGTEDPDVLIRDADAALHAAKEGGRGRSQMFSGATRVRMLESLEIENDLRRAIERKEFRLYCQPVVRLADRSITSFEALIRWNHPLRGLLGPLSFIPLAEESTLIHQIGEWVVREACMRAAAWQRRAPGDEPIAVSVNLSPRQLVDPRLPGVIESALRESRLDPASLVLELTEGVLIDDEVVAIGALSQISGLGAQIALDDFGSGFSSLGYLKKLPLDVIKLDRVFVEALEPQSPDAAIVSAVVELASSLSLTVIAEGVETNEQLEIIDDLGCGFVQGYLFSPPVPTTDLDLMIASPRWAQLSR